MNKENIAAISTGLVASGVAVIRISGDSPLEVLEKIFTPVGKVKVRDFEPNKMYVGEIMGEGFTDYGMGVYFKSPKSFTGEDTVEINCHGGIAIAKGILKKILKSGARLATNGEFTKRAFINGKLSLSSAEGLIDMINAEEESGVRAGYYLYREKLTKEIEHLQDLLTDALSEIDVDMDFPEEDLELHTHEIAEKNIEEVSKKIEELLSTYNKGRILKNGVNIGIIGKPNTGKSSLLNALMGYDKAIVSDIAGTTRDIVEGSIVIDGVRYNFSDTAGIRDGEDRIEMLGVNLSKKVALSSDLLLIVVDGNNIEEEDRKILEFRKGRNNIVVVNKIDKGSSEFSGDINISALKGTNLEELKQLIKEKTVGSNLDINGDFLCEERHYNALLNAKEYLEEAKKSMQVETLDLIAIDIKNAWDSLGEISGKTATEEIINNIFSKFCVGK